jgi:hypothetical protein
MSLLWINKVIIITRLHFPLITEQTHFYILKDKDLNYKHLLEKSGNSSLQQMYTCMQFAFDML